MRNKLQFLLTALVVACSLFGMATGAYAKIRIWWDDHEVDAETWHFINPDTGDIWKTKGEHNDDNLYTINVDGIDVNTPTIVNEYNPNTPPTKPGAPGVAGNVIYKPESATVTWTASTDNEDDDITYKLEAAYDGGDSFSVVTGADKLSTNSFTFTDALMGSHTSVKFRVTPNDGTIDGPVSDVGAVVTIKSQIAWVGASAKAILKVNYVPGASGTSGNITLTPTGNNKVNDKVQTKTIATGELSFDEISGFAPNKDYTFTIQQAKGKDELVTYDTAAITATVRFNRSEADHGLWAEPDYTPTITYQKASDGASGLVRTLTNVKNAAPTFVPSLQVSSPYGGTLEFKLTGTGIDATGVAKSVALSANETGDRVTGAVSFDQISYTKSGSYTYTIDETTASGKAEVAYNPNTIGFTIEVQSDGNGHLSLKETPSLGTFYNGYNWIKGNAKWTPEVTYNVQHDGENNHTPVATTFTLAGEAAGGHAAVSETKTSDGSASTASAATVTFTELSGYDAGASVSYTITPTNQNDDLFTQDLTVDDITITVPAFTPVGSDNASYNNKKPDYTVDVSHSHAAYTGTIYEAPGATLDQTYDTPGYADGLRFTISSASDGVPAINTAVKDATIKATADNARVTGQKVSYDLGRYLKAGDYTYTIVQSHVDSANPNVYYDVSAHTAVVSVTKKAEGGLEASVKTPSPVIQNGYQWVSGNVKFTPSVTHTLKNYTDAFKDLTFKFKVEAQDDAVTISPDEVEVTGNAQPSFNQVSGFSAGKTYSYLVSETTETKDPRIAYDETASYTISFATDKSWHLSYNNEKPDYSISPNAVTITDVCYVVKTASALTATASVKNSWNESDVVTPADGEMRYVLSGDTSKAGLTGLTTTVAVGNKMASFGTPAFDRPGTYTVGVSHTSSNKYLDTSADANQGKQWTIEVTGDEGTGELTVNGISNIEFTDYVYPHFKPSVTLTTKDTVKLYEGDAVITDYKKRTVDTNEALGVTLDGENEKDGTFTHGALSKTFEWDEVIYESPTEKAYVYKQEKVGTKPEIAYNTAEVNDVISVTKTGDASTWAISLNGEPLKAATGTASISNTYQWVRDGAVWTPSANFKVEPETYGFGEYPTRFTLSSTEGGGLLPTTVPVKDDGAGDGSTATSAVRIKNGAFAWGPVVGGFDANKAYGYQVIQDPETEDPSMYYDKTARVIQVQFRWDDQGVNPLTVEPSVKSGFGSDDLTEGVPAITNKQFGAVEIGGDASALFSGMVYTDEAEEGTFAPIVNSEFASKLEFKLTPEGGAPMGDAVPGQSTKNEDGSITATNIRTDSDGTKFSSFDFPRAKYTKAGEYKYTVSQVNLSNKAEWPWDSIKTYDDKVYEITVTVSKDGENLKAEGKLATGGKSADAIVFNDSVYRIMLPHAGAEGMWPIIGAGCAVLGAGVVLGVTLHARRRKMSEA